LSRSAQRPRRLDEEHHVAAAGDQELSVVSTLRRRFHELHPRAVALVRSISRRRWAGYLGGPLLILFGLAVLILLNVAHRSLWGQVLYAVAITTAVVWAIGRAVCRTLDIPMISVQRSLLWAVFAIVAFPVAIAHGTFAVLLLFGLPLLWLVIHVFRAWFLGRRGEPPPWIGLIAGLAALTLFVVLTPRVASTESPPRAAAIVTEEDQEQAALARRVRPVLLFHSSEARFPVNIGTAIAERLIEACRTALGSEPCKVIDRESDVDLAADYLHVADVVGPRGGGPNSSIYYRVVPAGDRVYVDYWWYFTRNPNPVASGVFCAPGFQLPGLTCHEHPSDWEGATVVLGPCETFGPPCTRFGDRRWAPVAVRYAQHEFVVSYAWQPTLLRLWRGWDRPVLRPLVFVANNSHASYPNACSRLCKQIRTVLGAGVSEGAHDGRIRWSQDGDCEACVRRLPLTRDGEPALWNAFDGRWGTQTCILAGSYCDAARAPGAPSKQSRYRDPGEPGPWLCLTHPNDPGTLGLRHCGRADPDDTIPGFPREA
jgi:hypothetical protein